MKATEFLRKEWPLFFSLLFFAGLMLLDYEKGFMANWTSLTSGPQSTLFVSAGFLTVITLAFLEGILGIDNATVLAIQVRHLKPEDTLKALTWGVWGAHLFRFIFLLAAGFILEQKWIMAIGAFYLVNLAADFFLNNFFQLLADLSVLIALAVVFYISQETVGTATVRVPVWIAFLLIGVFAIYRYLRERRRSLLHKNQTEEGITVARSHSKRFPLLSAIIAVEWTDILFSFDSIGAGVAMTRDFWVLFWGAFFGVTCLRLFAKSFVKLLDRFPQLEGAAMLAVLVVGVKMGFEAIQDTLKLHFFHIENWQTSLLVLAIFIGAFFVKTKTPHITEEKPE